MKILLADDCRVNQLVVVKTLLQAGFQIDTVGNGHDAVEAVRRGGYDVVLMDLNMPGMDGLQAT
jgi:CheY-like chemotaxis protein